MDLHYDFGKVAIVSGGCGSEREVSLMSGEQVVNALKSLNINCELIDIDKAELAYPKLQQFQPDRAFIAMHGNDGESGYLQAILEGLNIPYTGSGVAATALTLDKVRCKWLWRGINLPTPNFCLLQKGFKPEAVVEQLGLPLFVKPNRDGSSLGISKVERLEQLQPAYELASKNDPIVFAESFMSGGEYTVGIVNNESLPSIKIETPREFYDYQAKYFLDNTLYHCPAGLSDAEEQAIQALALNAFHSTGCEGFGRVDIMRDEKGEFKLIEINPIPGLTSHSLLPKAAKLRGLNFPMLCVKILEQTL